MAGVLFGAHAVIMSRLVLRDSNSVDSFVSVQHGIQSRLATNSRSTETAAVQYSEVHLAPQYYKQLFLCIVDMAIVKGYIVHCITLKKRGVSPPTHADHLRSMHNQLLSLQPINFERHMNTEDLVSVPIPRRAHVLVNTDEFYSSGKQHKRPQYLCKVRSAFADKNAKSYESSYFCQECSAAFGGRVPLCDSIRRKEEGNTHTHLLRDLTRGLERRQSDSSWTEKEGQIPQTKRERRRLSLV
ncbi:hypothetical protein F444_11683 [Phytophthora nicotianae P1976]|uniref:PiggyBac transposable element-derived protein domain-containing protein n=1 Tax=Phytophthora nicotianae P1976 TaxID=1317066 RepID=A0A080ZZN1_PHYNI|nr:hypothetical protein F444_11683 [Phytophthora nicotianae P1976]